MSQTKAAITGVNGYLPDYVLSNAELETMVETSDEWITTRTGIKERRLLKGEGLGSSFMGIQAVKGLLEKTNTAPEDVDLLICATVTADRTFPDNANTIAAGVGASSAWGFDINAACSGFLYSLNVGARFVESGRYRKVIVVGTDKMSSIVDYTDRTTCILFGDGAAAVLLEANEEGYGIQDEVFLGDGNGQKFLYMPSGGSVSPPSAETVANRGHYIRQEGRQVFKAAIAGMTSTITEVMHRNNLSTDDIDWVAPHQANMRIIQKVTSDLGFPQDRVMLNIQKYGNTTGATIPLCLWDYESQLKKGDKLILTAFGGGFTWGSTYLTWAYDGQ